MNNIKVGDKVVRSENAPDNGWDLWAREVGTYPTAPLTVVRTNNGLIQFLEGKKIWGAKNFTLLPAEDTVKKPKRYELFPGIESIQVIARTMTVAEFRGFCLGNTLKYRLRAGKKDDVKQELAKAEFYKELFERHRGECRAD